MSRTFTNKGAAGASAVQPKYATASAGQNHGQGGARTRAATQSRQSQLKGVGSSDTGNAGKAHPQGRKSEYPIDNAESLTQNQRMQLRDAYTVISPNEKKRFQVEAMARKETDEYERYKEERKMKYCSYVGTAGGSEVSQNEASVRIRQQNQSMNRVQRQQKSQQNRADQKRHQQKEYDEKRAQARRKSEMNAERERERQERLQQDHRRKNEEYLRKLEQGKKA